MAIDPATAKAIAQAAAKVVTDKETRNKLIYILIGGLAGLVVVILIPIYLLTHPIEAIMTALGGNNADASMIETFKQEYDINVLEMDSNLLWNDGAPYPMPLNGTILHNYGDSNSSCGEQEDHRGVDIQGAWYANVVAIADGVVEEIQSTDKNSILIKHKDADGNIFYSYYAYLSKVYLFIGQSVKQGAVIGLEGVGPLQDTTSTEHHLHFEIRSPGIQDAVDPAEYIFSPKQ